MYSTTICDPVGAGTHAILRFPIVGAILIALGGGYAACVPTCEKDQHLVWGYDGGTKVAVCEPLKIQ
jgi:hypothetical protein